MEQNMSFSERTKALSDAAHQLKAIAEMVMAEVLRMEATSQKWAEKKGSSKYTRPWKSKRRTAKCADYQPV